MKNMKKKRDCSLYFCCLESRFLQDKQKCIFLCVTSTSGVSFIPWRWPKLCTCHWSSCKTDWKRVKERESWTG